MATKKVAKVAAKKSVAKVAHPEAVNPEEGVELLEFSVSAVIPIQQYGNIQPRITVRGHSIRRAREIVMPIMESLYKQYAETPLNGKEPRFYEGTVTVEEKRVERVEAPEQKVPETPSEDAQNAVAGSPTNAAPAPAKVEKPEAVVKAERAIALAVTLDAIDLIKEKIAASEKIEASFKPALLELVDAKRKELDVF